MLDNIEDTWELKIGLTMGPAYQDPGAGQITA